jgi:hypothetical protein
VSGSDAAVAAAVAAARSLGVSCRGGTVLAARSNVIVALEGADVVARVSGVTGTVRPGRAWALREVTVAGWLARAGAPVVAPEGGPVEVGGFVVSLWTAVPAAPAGGGVDAAAAGAALRACHEALARFWGGGLPEWGAWWEARELAERFSVGVALGAALDARLAMLSLPLQVVHGDAHLRNVLAGPLWADWEDCFVGPVGWDLACLVAPARVGGGDPTPVAEALRGYGDLPVSEADLALLVAARAWQGAVWTRVADVARGEARPALIERALAFAAEALDAG